MALTAPGEYVTLTNVGDTPLTYRYQFVQFSIEPGASRTVPWGHFTYLMGDPFFTNADRNMDRETEYNRLLTLYGRSKGEAGFPKLEAHDADGDRIYSVMEDRTGTNAPKVSSNDPMDPAALRAQLEQMARRQSVLEELLKVHERATPNESISTPDDTAPPVATEPRPDIDGLEPVDVIDTPDIPEDTPKKVPVNRGRK